MKRAKPHFMTIFLKSPSSAMAIRRDKPLWAFPAEHPRSQLPSTGSPNVKLPAHDAERKAGSRGGFSPGGSRAEPWSSLCLRLSSSPPVSRRHAAR